MNKKFYVISHTHWDREWYEPFERFRIRLVRLIDNLLGILEKNPEYVFHLDAQTAVIDDYLEIKPYQEEKLKEYIRSGRILTGPWFVQNDFYLVSGESTIRNLMFGIKRAQELGRCEYVGYTPDQFGLPSQLPQIFNGFGIKYCILGRGKIHDIEKPGKVEFNWQSRDGSEVLSIFMPHWYNNAQRFSSDPAKANALIKKIKDELAPLSSTRNLLLMNGVDHLEAQENLLDIIPGLDQYLQEDEIFQSSLSEYCRAVESEIDNLENYSGELRDGGDHMILQGTLSSRVYLKILNVKAENAICHQLEPLCSMLLMNGFGEEVYDKYFLDYLWKLLIINHPHDSICGCSSDEVHRHMEDRYLRFFECLNHLLDEKMKLLSESIHDARNKYDDYYITVFNTSCRERNELVYSTVDFLQDENIKAFQIISPEGNIVDHEIIEQRSTERGIRSPINLPGKIMVDRYKIAFPAKVPPFGYTRFILKSCTKENVLKKSLGFENDYLKITVSPDGQIDLYDKTNDRQYNDILWIEDIADRGDSYSQYNDENATVFSTKSFIPEISCVRNNSLETIYELKYNFKLPECYEREKQCRSEKLIDNQISVKLGLNKNSKYLELNFQIQNNSKDHCLQAIVNTGIDSKFTYASSPFDVIRRDKFGDDVIERNDLQEPSSDFIHIKDQKKALSILHEGLHSYKHYKDSKGKLAIVLLRATGYISGYHSTPMDEDWIVPGNQCIREIDCRLALMPASTTESPRLITGSAVDFLNPMFCFSGSCDPSKISGGRPCVQDSEISEIFYRANEWEKLKLSNSNSFLEIKNQNIVLIACKKAENSHNIIIRLLNTRDELQDSDIKFGFPTNKGWECNLKEDILQNLEIDDDYKVKIKLKPRQIYTIAIELS